MTVDCSISPAIQHHVSEVVHSIGAVGKFVAFLEVCLQPKHSAAAQPGSHLSRAVSGSGLSNQAEHFDHDLRIPAKSPVGQEGELYRSQLSAHSKGQLPLCPMSNGHRSHCLTPWQTVRQAHSPECGIPSWQTKQTHFKSASQCGGEATAAPASVSSEASEAAPAWLDQCGGHHALQQQHIATHEVLSGNALASQPCSGFTGPWSRLSGHLAVMCPCRGNLVRVPPIASSLTAFLLAPQPRQRRLQPASSHPDACQQDRH